MRAPFPTIRVRRRKSHTGDLPSGWLTAFYASYDQETGSHRFLCVTKEGLFVTAHQEDVELSPRTLKSFA